jgi:hypothetical protein
MKALQIIARLSINQSIQFAEKGFSIIRKLFSHHQLMFFLKTLSRDESIPFPSTFMIIGIDRKLRVKPLKRL